MFNTKASSVGDVNNGFFELKFFNDGVYLIVHPPIENGKKVETREVIEKINRKQIRNFNKEAVEFAVAKANKVPVKIAEAQQEVKIDATATVMTSPDKMKAFITISPPEGGGNTLSKDKLIALLKEKGVVYGINNEIIESLAKNPVYNKMVCVAEGTLPVNGENGKIKFHFDINKKYAPRILEDGSVNFRELGLIEIATKGQVLCTLIPPTPGIPGKTVAGTDIPAKNGKPAILPKGKNVEISEDGMTLVSSIDGQVSYIDGKVNVFATYEVPADVDNSTGNISFIGNVIIRGNVLSGFIVEAGGDVEVMGVVEGALIKAGGNIILRRGMHGHGKGSLISGGDIVAKYIEHSNVEAKNDIKAEAIMHSNVKCGNKLELSGRKGLLVGGTCKVGKEIIAKVIGSYMATVTEIEVGVDPAVRERYKQIKADINNIETDLKKADQAINILKKLEAANALTPEKQDMLVKTVRTKIFLSNKLNELKEELIQVEAILQQEGQGKVRVYNTIYPGTKVTIGKSSMNVKENLQYCILYSDGADVRIGPVG
ncbi:MAG TPA: DUF342 domain-containing protein [Clostridiaceae bacterium]|nr:DUF342 domain-containing protein [Clostridiaceae bacterium]